MEITTLSLEHLRSDFVVTYNVLKGLGVRLVVVVCRSRHGTEGSIERSGRLPQLGRVWHLISCLLD